MKKLLACLIALLLPVSALAEGMAYRWTLDMPEDALVKLVQTVEEAFPELKEDLSAMPDNVLRGVAKLVDGVEMDIHAQEGLTQVGLRLKDEDIVEASMFSSSAGAHYVFDALPGLALTLPMNQEQLALSEQLALLPTDDWAGLGAAIQAARDEWLLTLPVAIERGSFAGEAYTGGVYRMTYQVDDRDLFVLMEELLHYSDLMSHVPSLEKALALSGLEMQMLLEQARQAAYEAAASNAYTYLVHTVSDGMYLTGVSAIAYQRGKQVATLSLGWPEDGFKAVLGYGYQGRNVYFSLDTQGSAWNLLMVKDDALEGYAAACADERNVLLKLAGSGMTNAGQQMIRAALTGAMLRDLELEAEIFMDSSLSDAELSVMLRVNGEDILRQMLRSERADDLPVPELSELRQVQLNEDGSLAGDAEQELESFLATLGIRIFKALPVELFTTELDIDDLFQ